MIVASYDPQNGVSEQGDPVNTRVFFDGVKQDNCVYADEALGLIKVIVYDERVVNGAITYSRPRFITRRGRVTLITHKWDDADAAF